MMEYCPDIIDWPHVVKVIEQDRHFKELLEEERKRMRLLNYKYRLKARKKKK